MSIITLSIDFELRWGVYQNLKNIDEYKDALLNVHLAVPRMLKILEDYDIVSTWATVGALGLEDWNQYFKLNPGNIQYTNKKLIFDCNRYSEEDPNGELHFAPKLVKMIANSNQELASHTFSHIYCKEAGVTYSDFLNDSKLISKLFLDKYNISPVSIVFPRNQVAFEDKLKVDCGLRIYRGVPEKNGYKSVLNEKYSYLSRFRRLSNDLLPGMYPSQYAGNSKTIGDIFVRFSLGDYLWSIQFNKIKKTLLYGEGDHHLWFHPHNIGCNLTRNIKRFEDLVSLIADVRFKKGCDIIPMRNL
jgi:peptidoglycan/xylan/chitin deacetylase (PgdA/CDA1 family)